MKKLFLLLMLALCAVVCRAEVVDLGTFTPKIKLTQNSHWMQWYFGSVSLPKDYIIVLSMEAENVEGYAAYPGGLCGYDCELYKSIDGVTVKDKITKIDCMRGTNVGYYTKDAINNAIINVNLPNALATATVTIKAVRCPDVPYTYYPGEYAACETIECPNCHKEYCVRHTALWPHECPCPYSKECVDTAECPCPSCSETVCYTHSNFPCGCAQEECPSCLEAEAKTGFLTSPAVAICCKHEASKAEAQAVQCVACGKVWWCPWHGTSNHNCAKDICPYTDECSRPLLHCAQCGAEYCKAHNKHLKTCTGCRAPNICPQNHECPKCPNIPNVCFLRVCSCKQQYCYAHEAAQHRHETKPTTDTPGTDGGTGKDACPDGKDCKKKTCSNCGVTYCAKHQSHTCSTGGNVGISSGVGSVTLKCPNTSECDVISCAKCGQLYCQTHIEHTCPDTSGGTAVPICPNQIDCQLVVCPHCDATYCQTHQYHATHYCPNLKDCVKFTCDKCEQVYCVTHDEHSCPDCPYTAHCVRKVCDKCGEVYCTATHATAHVCSTAPDTPADSGTTGGNTTPGGSTDNPSGGTSGSGTTGSTGTSGSGSTGTGSTGGGSSFILDLGGSSSNTNISAGSSDTTTDAVQETKADNSAVGLSVGAAGIAFGLGNSRPGEIFGQYDAVTQERLKALEENPQIRNWPLYDARKPMPPANQNYTRGGVNYVR